MPSSDAENRITNGRDEHSSVAGTISSIDDGNDSDDEYFELFQILAAAPINRSSLHTSQQLGQATTQLNSSPLASQRNPPSQYAREIASIGLSNHSTNASGRTQASYHRCRALKEHNKMRHFNPKKKNLLSQLQDSNVVSQTQKRRRISLIERRSNNK